MKTATTFHVIFRCARVLAASLACLLVPLALHASEAWKQISWNAEVAFELTTGDWRAIVSAERGRLVHFGPAEGDASVVFAPATKTAPAGFGGHRVWLGPQSTWQSVWPPPRAWEMDAADSTALHGARLELVMGDTGDGWPRLTRIYEIEGKSLVCRVALAAGGTRAAQVIQILQVRPPADLTIPVATSEKLPLGFMLLPPMNGRRAAVPALELPPHAATTGSGIRLLQQPVNEKFGFTPQTLVARYEAQTLEVARGTARGTEAGTPDEGFYTQVYLSPAGEPVVELEQLSPLFKAGEAAEFSMLLRLK